MTKELILFGGRPASMKPSDCPAWNTMERNHGQVFAAAYSKADLRRLLESFCLHNVPMSEINEYWGGTRGSTWGIHMEGIIPRRGIWLKPDKFGPGPVIHVFDGETNTRVGHLMQREAFVYEAPSHVTPFSPASMDVPEKPVTCTIIFMEVRLEASAANPNSKVLYISKELEAKDLGTKYLVRDGTGYKLQKRKMLVADFGDNDFEPSWGAYCLPGQEEQACAILEAACRKYVEEKLQRAQLLASILQNGAERISHDEYTNRYLFRAKG